MTGGGGARRGNNRRGGFGSVTGLHTRLVSAVESTVHFKCFYSEKEVALGDLANQE